MDAFGAGRRRASGHTACSPSPLPYWLVDDDAYLPDNPARPSAVSADVLYDLRADLSPIKSPNVEPVFDSTLSPSHQTIGHCAHPRLSKQPTRKPPISSRQHSICRLTHLTLPTTRDTHTPFEFPASEPIPSLPHSCPSLAGNDPRVELNCISPSPHTRARSTTPIDISTVTNGVSLPHQPWMSDLENSIHDNGSGADARLVNDGNMRLSSHSPLKPVQSTFGLFLEDHERGQQVSEGCGAAWELHTRATHASHGQGVYMSPASGGPRLPLSPPLRPTGSKLMFASVHGFVSSFAAAAFSHSRTPSDASTTSTIPPPLEDDNEDGDGLEADFTDAPRTPFSSLYGMPGAYVDSRDFDDDDVNGGRDVDTLLPGSHGLKAVWPGALSSSSIDIFEDALEGHDDTTPDGEPRDAGNSYGGRSRSVGRYRETSGGYTNGPSSRGGQDGGSGSGYNRSRANGGTGGHGRDDDDDGDGRDGRQGRAGFSSYNPGPDSDSDSSEDDADDAEPKIVPRLTRGSADTDDDDVPLARSIPTALKAQRSIRRQAQDETTERRRQRSLRQKPRAPATAPPVPTPPMPAPTTDLFRRATSRSRPTSRDGRGAHEPLMPSMPLPTTATSTVRLQNGMQDIIAPAAVPRTRTRAQTLSSKAPAKSEPFRPEDLAQRLASTQPFAPTAGHTSTQPRLGGEHLHPHAHHHASRSHHSQQHYPAHSRGPSADEFGVRAASQEQKQQTLRPMRSFHRTRAVEPGPTSAPPTFAPSSSPIPASNASVSRASSRARSDRSRQEPSSASSPVPAMPMPPQQAAPRPSADGVPSSSSHPSRSRSLRRPNAPSPAAAALPPLPPGNNGISGSANAFQVVSREPAPQQQKLPMRQQRIYVFDLQSFHMVEVGANTTAQDVLDSLARQGHLAEWAGVGNWMLHEVCQDTTGLERPLRPFEFAQDVVRGWATGAGALLARKTATAMALQPAAIPTSSPRRSGYVEYEAKRGSWKKRWLELREQGLFLSKKDTGKDEVFLCSVSNFDAYVVTRPGKSKLFHFAIKSTDSVTFFENKNDYMHSFACGETDGRQWIERIMLARSYVINQERNVIQSYTPSSTSPGAAANGAKSLARSGTRRGARPAQPLLDFASPTPAVDTPPMRIFEPGSLLAAR